MKFENINMLNDTMAILDRGYYEVKEKAAMIAVRTVNDFIEENSGSLDLVEWILFDEETLNIYKDALNQFKANKIVGTPGF